VSWSAPRHNRLRYATLRGDQLRNSEIIAAD
jgi:hypothetical protein